MYDFLKNYKTKKPEVASKVFKITNSASMFAVHMFRGKIKILF